MIVGPGALRQGRARRRAQAAALVRRDGWNGFNVLHTAASRMAGLMLGYAQKGGIADLEAAKPKLVLLLGADEVADDALRRRLQGLHRPPRRRGRAAGRPGPAGRGLCREARHLRQHRGPRAARRTRDLPAGRRARGLDDLARAVRPARQAAAVRQLRPAARARWSPTSRARAATGWSTCRGRRRSSTPRRRARSAIRSRTST